MHAAHTYHQTNSSALSITQLTCVPSTFTSTILRTANNSPTIVHAHRIKIHLKRSNGQARSGIFSEGGLESGQLANKPNTWRDLIAVCEELIANKYTSSKHLAIGGRSAGGITVGRGMTERPDLFAAVIDGVGWSNPLRYVAEQNGYGEEPEWGAIADPAFLGKGDRRGSRSQAPAGTRMGTRKSLARR